MNMCQWWATFQSCLWINNEQPGLCAYDDTSDISMRGKKRESCHESMEDDWNSMCVILSLSNRLLFFFFLSRVAIDMKRLFLIK